MAETQTTDGQDGGDNTLKTVVIILVVVALGAVGFYWLSSRNQPQSPADKVEEVAKDVEDAKEEAADEIAKRVEERLDLFKEFVEDIEPLLSEEGKEELQVVVVFVENDPTVLGDDEAVVPAEVETAADAVWAEVRTILGAGVLVMQEKMAIEQLPEEGTEGQVEVGTVATITGMWDVAELDADSPLGVVYSLVSNENGVTYYFVFDDATSEQVAELVGEEVAVEVEVTEVTEDRMVGYKVVSGPVLVAEVVEEEVAEEAAE